ncbi:MAG: hypothetical protein IPG51_13045 [Chloroflexi bacterium]|nr:hypothetical protein [Chloroflexota bacterium]
MNALSPDALASIAYANQEIFLAAWPSRERWARATLAHRLRHHQPCPALVTLSALDHRRLPVRRRRFPVARENLGVTLGLTAAAARC